MGNGAARHRKGKHSELPVQKKIEDIEKQIIIAHFTHPLFQLDEEIDIRAETVQLCKVSFEAISSGKSRLYERAKSKNPNVGEPLAFMIEDFYSLLFERIPASKRFFGNSVVAQAKMLTSVMRSLLEIMSFDTSATSIFEDLTHSHNKLGIHPSFYGEFAYTFVCTMRKHLGTSNFPEAVESAWVSLFSHVLRVMIPISVNGMAIGSTAKWRSMDSSCTTKYSTDTMQSK